MPVMPVMIDARRRELMVTPSSELTGVLLYNLGGPDDLDAVEPFLFNLFSDREIIELPFGAWAQPIVARVVARARASAVRRNYSLIGGGSPQLRITRAQAIALEHRLNAASDIPLGPSDSTPCAADNGTQASYSAARRFRVVIAMRYSSPSVDEALWELEAAAVHRVVSLTLFPQWSRATTGSWLGEFDRVLAMPRWRHHRFDISHIARYPDDPLYLDAVAHTVRSALERFAPEVRDRVVILFSAHGLPERFVDAGDPYVEHAQSTRRGVLERLRVSNREMLGFQSRTGPVKWIGPGTDELIRRLGAEGLEELLIVPLSFVSDHIETLYEVDILFKALARAVGITDCRRPAALNTSPLFIHALARLVERHLDARVQPVTRLVGEGDR